MKKIFFALVVFTTSMSFAQTIDDALQYTSSNLTGTARYRAMSGAFGALGGDLSAVSDNPAASAVFTSGLASVSFASDSRENRTTFFNELNVTDANDFSVNQVGGVFVIDKSSDSKWKKIALSFNYDRTANFDDQFVAQGFNPNSISEYFAIYAQGVPLSDLETIDGESVAQLYEFLGETQGFGAQQALLGYQSYILEPDSFDSNNTGYGVNTVGSIYDQEFISSTSGYNSKATFNLGAQYGDNLYLGLNLNSHFMDLERSTVLFESNDAGVDPGFVNVLDIRFQNNLRTLGSGFSFQLGGITTLDDNIRVGLTYDSPTWYTISEENSQRISTTSVDEIGTFDTSVNPRVLNVYEDYTIKSPAKYTGSFAYIFGKKGLLSFDYSYKNMNDLELRPESDSYFASVNTEIDNVLKPVQSYRLGGEMRSNAWSFRGGARVETTPYSNEQIMDDLFGYSLGVGYNFGTFKVDFAYDRYTQDRNQALYNVGLIDTAQIESENSSLVATLSLSL